MTIVELDIFNSVFIDENFIESERKENYDLDPFISILDFYDNLKNELESNIEIEERDKLINSIPDYINEHANKRIELTSELNY